MIAYDIADECDLRIPVYLITGFLDSGKTTLLTDTLNMDYFKEEKSPLPKIVKWLFTNQAMNFLTVPDFVAYRFADRKTFSNLLVRKFWSVQGVTWTLKSQKELDRAVAEGWLPIFEGFKP